MKYMNIFYAMIVYFSLSGSAQARCLDENWIWRGSKVSLSGACAPEQDLALATKPVHYPRMSNNPYTVRYWQGSWARTVLTESTYLHMVLDKCSYPPITVISELLVDKSKSQVSFPVYNPNLEDTVNATYQLMPMTNSEAMKAFDAAKIGCEQYVPE